MSEVIATRRLVSRLLLVVVVMFCFGIFVLPPFYDAMCRVFGINGKTAGAYQGEQMIDVAREVRVQFLATNSAGMIWEFGPQADEIVVHPGEVRDMLFVAYNPSDQPMMAQAVPSYRHRGRRPSFTRPSASVSPSRCCSQANASKCRCASSSTVTCHRT